MRRFIAAIVSAVLVLPASSFAVTQEELVQKIQDMNRQLEELKQQMEGLKKEETKKEERISKVEEKVEETGGPSWLEIGGDYRFRFDSLKGEVHDYYHYGVGGVSSYDTKNDSLLTNRFGLNLKANPLEDITVKARLLMYKVWGHGTSSPVNGSYFADRALGVFDGTTTHVPQDNTLRVDYAYATWSNIAELPVWFSIGRRPSTGGPPMYLRQNTERISTTAGVQGLLVDYAFDGLTVGAAPDIPGLPGAFAKFCYGKGYDSGYRTKTNTLKDVNMAGLSVIPYSVDNLHLEIQANKGFSIFDNLPDAPPTNNLGDIGWLGTLLMGTLNNVGPGDLNLFASAALSKTYPNDNLYGGMAGLLYDVGRKKSHTGNAIYLGTRYDIKTTSTKIGAEFNHGSQHWITFVPAGDDIWTSKLGTRGNVYEVYLVQELNKKPIAKRGKAFFRVGYQYYKFDYTGSNNWVGEAKKIADLTTTDASKAQMLVPLQNAQDIYMTFDVLF